MVVDANITDSPIQWVENLAAPAVGYSLHQDMVLNIQNYQKNTLYHMIIVSNTLQSVTGEFIKLKIKLIEISHHKL